ncbi:MAG TPA: NADH-quinone oxidoreductase subunit NuoB [Thermoplasmata archaeon]|nr:NADH-quinone oxidoreductase subunit NuoB [Thermoplasmata archaeon]
MPSWIGQAVRYGIVTSRYPEAAATDAEVPATGRPPAATDGTVDVAAAAARCPVGAIREGELDRGRCVRCARCLPNGFAFSGPVEAATRHRSELRVGTPAPHGPGLAAAEPPLANFPRSLHVFLVDVGSCNACNLEVMALANPFYDASRLGIFFTNSPRHADVLLVVGVPTEEMVEPLRRAYEALPAPKAVVAVGVCPISGGAFRGSPGLKGSLDEIVPVDLYVPGCPPSPVNVLDGLLRVIGRGRAGGER